MDQALELTFPGAPKDRANILADDLRKELKRLNSSLSVEKQRNSEAAQDFGATLAVIVTSAAVTALAKGIANFIAKHGTKIKIKAGEDIVEATGIESKDAAARHGLPRRVPSPLFESTEFWCGSHPTAWRPILQWRTG
jgi:hypothetical protein